MERPRARMVPMTDLLDPPGTRAFPRSGCRRPRAASAGRGRSGRRRGAPPSSSCSAAWRSGWSAGSPRTPAATAPPATPSGSAPTAGWSPTEPTCTWPPAVSPPSSPRCRSGSRCSASTSPTGSGGGPRAPRPSRTSAPCVLGALVHVRRLRRGRPGHRRAAPPRPAPSRACSGPSSAGPRRAWVRRSAILARQPEVARLAGARPPRPSAPCVGVGAGRRPAPAGRASAAAARGRAAARPGHCRQRALPAARRRLRRAALHRPRRRGRAQRSAAHRLVPARPRLRRRHRHRGVPGGGRARSGPGVPAARGAAVRGHPAGLALARSSRSRCWPGRWRRCSWSAASRPTATRPAPCAASAAGVAGGVLFTALVVFAGGAVGPGRMADVGATCCRRWSPRRSRWASAVSWAASRPPGGSRRR